MSLFGLLSDWLPPSANDGIWKLYFSATPYLGATIPIHRIRGSLRGGEPATLLTAARSSWLNSLLSARFFQEAPHIELVDTVKMRRLSQSLSHLRGDADLTICLLPSQFGRHAFEDQWLIVPPWVGLAHNRLDELESIIASSHSVTEDMRLVRRHAYRPVFSPGAADLEEFHLRFQVPTASARHGERGYTHSPRFLQRRLRQGGVIWLENQEGREAAMAVEVDGGRLQLWAIGLRDGDQRLLKKGAMAGLYYFSLLHARSTGCSVADLRGCRPFLSDGLFRYKRKWGCSLYDKTDLSYENLLVSWPRWSPAASAILAQSGVIFRHAGQLHALTSAPTPIANETIPGLSSLVAIDPLAPPHSPSDLINRLSV